MQKFIEAKDAVIYWNSRDERNPFEEIYVDVQPRFGGKQTYSCSWTGRGDMSWEELTDMGRVHLMNDMAIEMMVWRGCDPATVMREFCKVRQFYEQGARSYPMRRAISHVIHGEAREDWPPGSNEGGPRF